RRSFYDLATALWNHLPEMADRLRRRRMEIHLSPREAGDLFAFLYSIDYYDEPGDRIVGRALFSEKRCVMCHQVEGVGGVVGPNLDFLGSFRSPIPVAAAMWNHGPEMIGEMRRRGIERPSFRGSELVDLIAYLRSAARTSPTEGVHVLPGSAREGRELFGTKSCVRCHAVRGRGGNVGPDLAAPGLRRSLMEFAATMWNKAPRMLRAMEARNVAIPHLEASEMADIVAYLYSVRYFTESGSPERGRALLSSKGCTTCHGVGGEAPDLAGRWYESHAAVFAVLWNHARIEAIPVEWSEMTTGEMADLIAYFLGPER
ncbi:MAG: cytochrome c, partial [Gemmatimonadota bacterium]|nr:cytochrome c [Gemmatimonadota bacterium]